MRTLVAGMGCTLLLASGCATGEGKGDVTSSKLYVENCWDGAFDLRPTFFASDPFQDTQQIRIQRGERITGVSDGVTLLVNDVSKIRESQLNQAIPLGLPVGVRPPGFPILVQPNPPQVSLTLYLNDTCHLQNGALYAVEGSITFTSLFSGDRNENDAEDRLTEATFTAMVTDPRDATFKVSDGTGTNGPSDGTDAGTGTNADAGVSLSSGGVTVIYDPEHTSRVEGSFSFYFQRGSPAQPFP